MSLSVYDSIVMQIQWLTFHSYYKNILFPNGGQGGQELGLSTRYWNINYSEMWRLLFTSGIIATDLDQSLQSRREKYLWCCLTSIKTCDSRWAFFGQFEK